MMELSPCTPSEPHVCQHPHFGDGHQQLWGLRVLVDYSLLTCLKADPQASDNGEDHRP